MVEKIKKYKFGVRRFGLVNWVGAWTLYQKEDDLDEDIPEIIEKKVKSAG